MCELIIIITLRQYKFFLFYILNQVLEPRQTCDEIQEASKKLLQLCKQSEELTGNIKNITNETMEKIREIDPQKVKVTSETKKLCSEILIMVDGAKTCMEDVDSFAQHGKHSKQHELVLLSIRQEIPTLQPLNDYMKLLLRCLDKIEYSHKSFCKSSERTETTLQQLMAELKEKGDAEDTKETVSAVATGVGAGGVVIGAAAILAGLFTGGVGTFVVGAAATAMSAGVARYAYTLGTEFMNKKRAYWQLAKQTRVIKGSAKSMQLTVFTISKSFKEIGNGVENIRHYKPLYTTLLVDPLKQLFNNMSLLRETSFECCKVLVSLQVNLKAHVRLLTVAETRPRDVDSSTVCR